MLRLIIVPLFFTCTALLSQSAVDITFTDSEGQTHTLYEDYLDQGKTVLIKIFFTFCPPCNSIAPLMEPLYQEWGAGEADVEFFELSTMASDSDTNIENYKAQHGITFPSAGSDGGSLQALEPYMNGTFGQFTGTPFFIVIAPDGTVQYDVTGPGNAGKIAAIDAAIAATGAIKPGGFEPVVVSGQITDHHSSTGLANVVVEVVRQNTGTPVYETTTDLTGAFQLEMHPDSINGDFYVQASLTGDPKTGISATDLLLIQKHLLNVGPLTDVYLLFAADANGNGSISALDIFTLQRLLLGYIQALPDGQVWQLIPSDIDFGVPGSQPPPLPDLTIPLQDILNGTRQPGFIAVKRGNINE